MFPTDLHNLLHIWYNIFQMTEKHKMRMYWLRVFPPQSKYLVEAPLEAITDVNILNEIPQLLAQHISIVFVKIAQAQCIWMGIIDGQQYSNPVSEF